MAESSTSQEGGQGEAGGTGAEAQVQGQAPETTTAAQPAALIPSPLPEGVEVGKVSLKILGQRTNPLLQRKEVEAVVYHVGLSTPQRLQIREELAKALGVDKDLVYVVHVYTQYGIGVSRVIAHIYDDKKVAELVEPLYVRLRNMPRDEAKKILDQIRSRKKAAKKPAAKGGG